MLGIAELRRTRAWSLEADRRGEQASFVIESCACLGEIRFENVECRAGCECSTSAVRQGGFRLLNLGGSGSCFYPVVVLLCQFALFVFCIHELFFQAFQLA